MNPEPIRVLIVDDHFIVRKGIRALLVECEDIQFVGEACDGLEAIQQVESVNPDVILMDLVMPQMDGIEAIGRIVAENPDVRILAITTDSGDDQVFPAIKAGANGYLLKDSGSGELLEAIRQVHRGEPFLHPLKGKTYEEVGQVVKILAFVDAMSDLEPDPDHRACALSFFFHHDLNAP